MKAKVFAALAAALAITIGCATTMSLPDQLDKFVEKTEKEYKNYTEDDWKKSKEEFEALSAQIEENYDSFSTSDKVRSMKAMGKYGSLVLQNEISGASEALGTVLESIPETINGIINDIDTARLRKSVEGLTESIDTAKLREKLEALSKIFGLE